MGSAIRRPNTHAEREYAPSISDEVVLMAPARSNRGPSNHGEDGDSSSKTSNTKEKVIVATTIKPESSSTDASIDANRRPGDEEDLYRQAP